eukprot:CAMPEP_0195606796 /NCGR_PEP_ID=MMETSP0815-20121206/7876_1 /TAXON_ID=97485 /ORGANISM="Prymnesium parvum, Strain Texoma1" /LENGTH=128 /DNA_ID=CAMNT_0040746561 /DNA_START=194 /DNA_END=581 /DNA_ORIENTATION=+
MSPHAHSGRPNTARRSNTTLIENEEVCVPRKSAAIAQITISMLAASACICSGDSAHLGRWMEARATAGGRDSLDYRQTVVRQAAGAQLYEVALPPMQRNKWLVVEGAGHKPPGSLVDVFGEAHEAAYG